MSTVKCAEYGSWKSELTPDVFGQGNCGRLSELQTYQESIFWIEQNISTDKREIYECKSGSTDRIQWAVGYSVQNAVHEYGGGSYVVLPDGSILFTTVDGVWLQKKPAEQPEQVLDSMLKTHRYADFCVAPNGSTVLAVEEVHKATEGQNSPPVNHIVYFDLHTKEKGVLTTGCDFYAQPRMSVDGRFLSWMEWNHTNMPWDETVIRVAKTGSFLQDKQTRNLQEIATFSGVGKSVNYYCPTWHPLHPAKLLVVCDKTNFWNVYEVDIEADDQNLENVYPVDEEIGFPAWNFGDRPFATNGKHTVLAVRDRLYVREGSLVSHIPTPSFCSFSFISITEKGVIYAIALGPKRAATVIRYDLNGEAKLEAVRESRSPASIDRFDISEPERIDFTSSGVPIYGYYYKPKNSAYTAPEGSLPPVLLVGHPGPTLPCSPTLDLKKQFFTTRGAAVFDVCYRGSSGEGSMFRNMLYRNWGIADRDDFLTAAKAVIDRGLGDPKKILLMGSSASGFTLLACLIAAPPGTFAAAVSIYGVADLMALAKDTHKFELGYNEALLGKLPEEEEEYKRRSPTSHIDKINTPCAFIHGLEDTVVPVQQSVEMYKALAQRGIFTGLLLFPDEGHGFRGAKAKRESIEAAFYFMMKAIKVEPGVESEMKLNNVRGEDGEAEQRSW